MLDEILARIRRGHGRARRPRRRDRRRRGAAPAEADHPARARAREAGDHGDADARVDDPRSRSRRGPRRATSRTRSSTGRPRVMLSGETAVGEYPIESVAYMDRIARVVEPSLGYRHEIPEASEQPAIGQAMSNAACDIAEALEATAMLVPTFTGRTASAVARLRPRRPIIGADAPRSRAAQQMALEWGVVPVEIKEASDVEELWRPRWRPRARAERRAGRPGRHHGRDRREHSRVDERDQGRHRLGRRRQEAAGLPRKSVPVADRSRRTRQAGKTRRGRTVLCAPACSRPPPPSASSTTSRSRPTSGRARRERGPPRSRRCAGAERLQAAARALLDHVGARSRGAAHRPTCGPANSSTSSKGIDDWRRREQATAARRRHARSRRWWSASSRGRRARFGGSSSAVRSRLRR